MKLIDLVGRLPKMQTGDANKDLSALIAALANIFRLTDYPPHAIGGFIEVEDYIRADATDHTTGIRAAGAALSAAGGGILWFKPRKTYTVWTSDTSDLLSFSGVNGITILGNGCIIDSAQTNGPNSAVVFLSNCDHVTIDGLTLAGSNTTLTASTGEALVEFQNDCRNLRVTNCKASDALHYLYGSSIDVSTRSCSGLYVDGGDLNRVYYGLSGWLIVGGRVRYRSINGGRSFFIQNCKQIEAWIESEPGGPLSDCLIKTYTDNTQSAERNTTSQIRLHYKSPGRYALSGNQSNDEACVDLELEHAQTTKAPGTLSNIEINLQVACTADKFANLVTFRKFYNNAGTPGAVDTNAAISNHIVNNITIRGSAVDCNNLVQNGINLFATFSSMNWTNDAITGIKVENLTLSGAPTNDIYVNGQGAVSNRKFLTVDNYEGNDTISLANTADVEIEGLPLSFTPGISFGGGTTGITYLTQTGRAVLKNGVVQASGAIVLSNKGSSTGAAKITGLPFTVRNNNDSANYAGAYLVNVTFTGQHQALLDANAKTIALNAVTEAGNASNLTDVNFSNTSQVQFTATYHKV